ncbi:MAG TPA: cytidylate kinase-like family protein [Planctomycetota bacterium]|jgi:cytidylate kinase
MTSDGLKLFRALVRSENAGHAPAEDLPHGCTVTISRTYGSRASESGTLLAKALGVRYFDRELLDAVVAEARGDEQAMARLDEHVTPIVSDWLYSLVRRQDTDRDVYRRCLIDVLLKISQAGGVIVGRGAYLVLAHVKAFHVRIIGSSEACAKRVADRERISLNEALLKCARINAEREAFLRANFGKEPSEQSHWDLILNTDRLDVAPAVKVILTGMQAAGFSIPERAWEKAESAVPNSRL